MILLSGREEKGLQSPSYSEGQNRFLVLEFRCPEAFGLGTLDVRKKDWYPWIYFNTLTFPSIVNAGDKPWPLV